MSNTVQFNLRVDADVKKRLDGLRIYHGMNGDIRTLRSIVEDLIKREHERIQEERTTNQIHDG